MKNESIKIPHGKISSGSAKLDLVGDLSSGRLEVVVDLQINGKEKRMIINGKLDGKDYYCTLLSGDPRGHLAVIYSRYQDQSHTLVLCDEKHNEVGIISYIGGSAPPQFFRVDLRKLNLSKAFDFEVLCESILDEKKADFLLMTKNWLNDPIKKEEVLKVFGNDPAYLAFQSFDLATTAPTNWHPLCWGLLIPGSGLFFLLAKTCRMI
jgi:hypothetical protein